MVKRLLEKFKKTDQALLEDDSRSGSLFAVTSLYDTPDEIIHAAKEVADLGFKDYDVYTPYPVHGLDDAMKLKESQVGKVSFTFGLIGTISALSMIGWMSGIDYQNIIGGKPFFNLPASIPITFELTILFCGIMTVFGMLLLFNKLPQISNPLQDTNFMKRVASDKFGIAIEATDPLFNESQVKDLFAKLHGKDIGIVNYPEDLLVKETPIFDKKFLGTLVLTAIIVSGGTYLMLNQLTFILPFNWMHWQFRVNPQTTSTFYSDGRSMREPVEGTVARGFMPYQYKGLPDSVIKVLSNPLPTSQKVLDQGQYRFNTYCSPCHGYYGKGDSRLHGQFPAPPSLHSDKVRNWPDGNIYNVITNGQNIMPSYAKQIPREDRWAIVHYIRALQRSGNATEEDLKTQPAPTTTNVAPVKKEGEK